MFIALEGLDCIGKSTFLTSFSNELYENYNISSRIVSPTKESKKIYNLINDSINGKDTYLKLLKEHYYLLDKLQKEITPYSIIFLDRSVYSAYAYNSLEINKEKFEEIKRMESIFKLNSIYYEIPEYKRQQLLLTRSDLSLYDKASQETTQRIKDKFNTLCAKTNLNKITELNQFKQGFLQGISFYKSL